MQKIQQIFNNNHQWSIQKRTENPNYFTDLVTGQKPQYLWIGCADSRVPAETLTMLKPGELFVHRNIANMVLHTDTNCLAVIEYAINILKIEHIIICGHTNCGGINAAMQNQNSGHIHDWLLNIHDIIKRHQQIFNNAAEQNRAELLLTQLNVIEQVYNLGRSSVVQSSWQRGRRLFIHGWIYDITDGYLVDLDVIVNSKAGLEDTYNQALAALTAVWQE